MLIELFKETDRTLNTLLKNTVSDCDLDPYSFTKKEPSLSTSS